MGLFVAGAVILVVLLGLFVAWLLWVTRPSRR